MTVIVANHTPDAIRGMLKRWFVEPKPNVFVGTVNKRTREKTLAYIRRNAPGLGLLVIGSDNSSQGFFVEHFGETDRISVTYVGLNLIAEKWAGKSEEEAAASDLGG
jgi:CRISPR-associated protein Cas2